VNGIIFTSFTRTIDAVCDQLFLSILFALFFTLRRLVLSSGRFTHIFSVVFIKTIVSILCPQKTTTQLLLLDVQVPLSVLTDPTAIVEHLRVRSQRFEKLRFPMAVALEPAR